MRNKTRHFLSNTHFALSIIVGLIDKKIHVCEQRREKLNAALILIKNPNKEELENVNYWNFEIKYLENIKSLLHDIMNNCKNFYQ
jgi:hypothetical protein